MKPKNQFYREAIIELTGATEFDVDDDCVIHHLDNPPDKSSIVTKAEEIEKKYWEEWEKKSYQRDRKLEYPTIEELVVALYDEEDKQALIEKRNAVKAKYPKPE